MRNSLARGPWCGCSCGGHLISTTRIGSSWINSASGVLSSPQHVSLHSSSSVSFVNGVANSSSSGLMPCSGGGPPELRGFSRNLRRDWEAIKAGLTVHWSLGSVEGRVNKLKVIKRQMFGRARFDLLRARVLLAN